MFGRTPPLHNDSMTMKTRRPSRGPARNGAKISELKAKIPAARERAEATHDQALSAKVEFKRVRKVFKRARKAAKEARRRLKALKKALRLAIVPVAKPAAAPKVRAKSPKKVAKLKKPAAAKSSRPPARAKVAKPAAPKPRKAARPAVEPVSSESSGVSSVTVLEPMTTSFSTPADELPPAAPGTTEPAAPDTPPSA